MTRSKTPSILLLHPSSFYYPVEQERYEIKSSMLLLGSYLAQFFPVTYGDFEITIGRPTGNIQIKRFERRVREYLEKQEYDILALSCWTSLSYKATISVAKIAREIHPDRLIVVGGYHPTARPDDFQTPDNLFDFLIRGEGELALKQLAESSPATGRPSQTQIIDAPSVLPENFVDMKWDLVEPLLQAEFPSGIRSVALFLSRGCPFDCSFCMESLKERRWHPYSPEKAVEQVQTAVERLKVEVVNFGDACFGLRSRWRKEFFKLLIETKPSYWITFETRPEFFDEEDIKMLSNLKVAIELGVESCSPKMLHLMNKTRGPEKFLEDFHRTSRLFDQYGVIHMANIIFNHPGETEQTLSETFDFIDDMIDTTNSSLTWACHGYMYYPGSLIERNRPFYEKEFGTIIQEPTWWHKDEDQLINSRKVIPSHDLNGARLDLWRQMFKDRSEQFKRCVTPEAFRFAADTYHPSWRTDPRYRQK